MKIVIVIFFVCISLEIMAKEISLSFDDAPRLNSGYFDGVTRTNKIIENLQKAKVKRAAFYINTIRLNSNNGLERIKKYKEAGHLIGNHTHSHIDIRSEGLENYKADFMLADKI